MVQNITILSKCCSFELSIHHKIPQKCIVVFTHTHARTHTQIKYNLTPSNKYIRMISEWRCETEEWSNGSWKFSFAIKGMNYILNIFK